MFVRVINALIPCVGCCADTDPVKAEEPEAERRLGVKEKRERRTRKGRRSTGIVLPGEEVERTHTHKEAESLVEPKTSPVWFELRRLTSCVSPPTLCSVWS